MNRKSRMTRFLLPLGVLVTVLILLLPANPADALVGASGTNQWDLVTSHPDVTHPFIDIRPSTVPEPDVCTTPPPGMVAWWPLDETTGTTATDMVDGNDGTHINGPTPITGMVDYALDFDGVDDYIEVPDAPSLNFGEAISGTNSGDFSIDAWVKLDPNNSGIKTIIDKRITGSSTEGYTLYTYNGELSFQLADGVGSSNCSTSPSSSCTNYGSGVNIADGQWHFVAITVDRDQSSGGRWYIDGVEVGTPFNPTYRTGSLVNSAPLRIARHASGSAYLKGTLDEVGIFDRVLTPTEIQAIYDAGSAGKCKDHGNHNFDARIELTEGVFISPSETQLAAEAQLREELPDLAVTYERTTGAVRTLYNMI